MAKRPTPPVPERQPLGLLLSPPGDYDLRHTNKIPPGYAPIWFSGGQYPGHISDCRLLLEILALPSALICTRWDGRPIHGGVLIPAEAAERVARIVSLIETKALRVDRGGFTQSPRLTAVSPRYRVEIVELPAD